MLWNLLSGPKVFVRVSSGVSRWRGRLGREHQCCDPWEYVRGGGVGGQESGVWRVPPGLGPSPAPGARHLPLQRLLLRQRDLQRRRLGPGTGGPDGLAPDVVGDRAQHPADVELAHQVLEADPDKAGQPSVSHLSNRTIQHLYQVQQYH